mmetsp:Transcript_16281/g.35427  ORF Transcript_16281/g.35427 Transcript_16281/m.35427 type:complete len:433 (-) Transcript_16281:173-1471(-)
MRHVGRVGGGGHGVGGGRLAVVRHRLRIVGRRVLQLVALAAVQALREEEVDVEQVQQGKDERCHEDAVLPEGMDVGGLRSEVGFVSTARRIDFRLVRRVALVVIVCVKHSRPTPPPMPVPLVVDVGQITAQKRPDGEAESESGQRESEGRHPSVAVFDHVGYVSKSQRERRGEQSGECEQRHEHIYAMKGGDEVHRKTDAFGTEGGVPAPFGGLARVDAIQQHVSFHRVHDRSRPSHRPFLLDGIVPYDIILPVHLPKRQRAHGRQRPHHRDQQARPPPPRVAQLPEQRTREERQHAPDTLRGAHDDVRPRSVPFQQQGRQDGARQRQREELEEEHRQDRQVGTGDEYVGRVGGMTTTHEQDVVVRAGIAVPFHHVIFGIIIVIIVLYGERLDVAFGRVEFLVASLVISVGNADAAGVVEISLSAAGARGVP